MSEEEIINDVLIELHKTHNETLRNLLDLYNKEKEENQNLKEEDYAWHQLLRMQNSREYRSKFLEDFRKEFGENVMPDYDEIYKRYDKQKQMIELMAQNLTTPIHGKEWVIKYFESEVELENEDK